MSAIEAYDLVGIGVAAVDDLLYVSEYPAPNVKTPIFSVERHGGGPACTAVAAVGSLQGQAAYVARLGYNDLSAFIESALKERQVDVSHLIRDSTAAPYHSYIVVDRSGCRNVFFDASSFRPVTVDDISRSLIESARLVLVDHVADPALLSQAEKVRSMGAKILGDIECCSESALRLTQLVDYLVVPQEFAHWASRSRNALDACRYFSSTNRSATVVTAGAAGCYYCSGNDYTVTHVPAFKVQAFDTNGCGDTFHGAFGLGVARGFTLHEAITFASAAAAIKAFSAGGKQRGWHALPTLEDVIELIRSQSPRIDHSALLSKIATISRSAAATSQEDKTLAKETTQLQPNDDAVI